MSLGAILASALGAVYALRARVPLVAVALGILLPVDVLRGVPSPLLDAARYALVLTLVLRVPPRAEAPRPVVMVGALLGLTGIVTAISGLTAGETGLVTLGVAGLISAFAGTALFRRPELHFPLLAGFLVGITASAADILAQAAGLPYLGRTSVYGLDYSGFSEKRTLVAPLLAVAAILYLSPALWKRLSLPASAAVRIVGTTVTTIALVLSAGRGGFLALGASLCVWAALSFRSRPAAVAGAAALLTAVLYTQRDSALINRLSTATTEDARTDRNESAWNAYLSAPILGPDPTSPIARAGGNAHTPILVFAVNAGLLGLVTAVVATLVLAWAVWSGARSSGHSTIHGPLMGVVMLVTTALEPAGFLVGISRTTLMFIAIYASLAVKPPAFKNVRDAPVLPAGTSSRPSHGVR
jgi:hypothetical protein